MEEILASIRRIISDDSPSGTAGSGASSSSLPADDDVFELSPSLRADPPPSDAELSSPPPLSPDIVESPSSLPEFVVRDTPAAPPVIMARPLPPEPPETFTAVAPAPDPTFDSPLISPRTAAAASAALAGLNHSLTSSSRFEGHTVEALVRELLRPMLREWMDANLPTLVERLVETEIERLARRGR